MKYMDLEFKEPTVEQCSNNEVLIENDERSVCALWYPQMGGYIAKAVCAFVKHEKEPCIDAYIWHDGEFPFYDEDTITMEENKGNPKPPVHLHHCDASQFIDFGNNLLKLIKKQHVPIEYDYIKFEEIELIVPYETNTWICRIKKSDVNVGQIKWYDPQKQYCYFPVHDTVYIQEDMEDIATFIRIEMEKREE